MSKTSFLTVEENLDSINVNWFIDGWRLKRQKKLFRNTLRKKIDEIMRLYENVEP